MKSYYEGWYCRSPEYLRIINKYPNKLIINHLRANYPGSLDAKELAKKTRLPIKTVYAQLTELRRARLVRSFHQQKEGPGRPARDSRKRSARWRYVLHDSDLSPHNCVISPSFSQALEKCIDPGDIADLHQSLVDFLQSTFRRMKESSEDTVSKWVPDLDSTCTICGTNHELLNYCGSLFLNIIQKTFKHHSFYDFLHENGVIDFDEYMEKAYEEYK